MTMTNEEICRDYRAAKAPSKQIHILADLNQYSREKIKQILVEGGCKLPGNCVGTKTKSKGVALAGPAKAENDTPEINWDTPMHLDWDTDLHDKPAKLPGAKHDDGKLQLSAVPPEAIVAIARIREYGNRKYADPENWRRVLPEKFHEAMLRHCLAIWEDPFAVDPESGLPHLWHLMCNGAFLCAMMKEETK